MHVHVAIMLSCTDVNYTIIIQFISFTHTHTFSAVDPIITLAVDSTGPTDYRISCSAIAHPQINDIKLFEIRPDGSLLDLQVSFTNTNQISSNLDFDGSAVYSGSENCPKNYRCRVSTNYSNRSKSIGTCLTSKCTCT